MKPSFKIVFFSSLTIAYLGIASVLVTNLATAQVAQMPSAPSTPDITLTGGELDHLFRLLSVPDLYQRQPNGSMLPVMNEGVNEAIKMIGDKVKDQIESNTKAAEAKKKADADAASKAAQVTAPPSPSSVPDTTKTP